MGIIIDCTRAYNRVCYNLKGDGGIAPLVHEELEMNIKRHIAGAVPSVAFPMTWKIIDAQALNLPSFRWSNSIQVGAE